MTNQNNTNVAQTGTFFQHSTDPTLDFEVSTLLERGNINDFELLGMKLKFKSRITTNIKM